MHQKHTKTAEYALQRDGLQIPGSVVMIQLVVMLWCKGSRKKNFLH